mmetsp:Transcript_203/g.410  ORF Transcript_203/g.410 Transcript_203/m.410 type:complete len:253 (+) Transcript_203:2038-2796(+)
MLVFDFKSEFSIAKSTKLIGLNTMCSRIKASRFLRHASVLLSTRATKRCDAKSLFLFQTLVKIERIVLPMICFALSSTTRRETLLPLLETLLRKSEISSSHSAILFAISWENSEPPSWILAHVYKGTTFSIFDFATLDRTSKLLQDSSFAPQRTAATTPSSIMWRLSSSTIFVKSTLSLDPTVPSTAVEETGSQSRLLTIRGPILFRSSFSKGEPYIPPVTMRKDEVPCSVPPRISTSSSLVLSIWWKLAQS